MTFPSTVLLVTGVLVATMIGGAAALFADAGDRCPGSDRDPKEQSATEPVSANAKCDRLPFTCPTEPVPTDRQQSSKDTGLLRFEFDLTKRGGEVRICIQDETGQQVIDRTVDLPQRTLTPVEAVVPAGPLHVGYAIDGRVVSTHKNLDVTDCPRQAYVFSHQVGLGWFRSSTKSSSTSGCFDPDEVGRQDAAYTLSGQEITPPGALLPGGLMRNAVIAMGVAATIGLAWAAAVRTDRIQWVLAGLFTRIRPRRALDHRVRAGIEQAVRADPGIRQDGIRTLLELGHGQTAHHLQILVRHGVLEPLVCSGARHLFPAGVYGAEEKKRLALLHHRAARTLYEALNSHGDSDITTLAAKCGYSVPYTSRLSARLASAGLVTRRRQGQRVMLGPK